MGTQYKIILKDSEGEIISTTHDATSENEEIALVLLRKAFPMELVQAQTIIIEKR